MNFKIYAEKHLTWDSLRSLGSNRLLTSSSVFLFVVPVAARLLSEVPPRIVLPISNYEIPLNLRLPFSWTLLFFAALFLLLGNIFFFFFCPTIVKQFGSYDDFERAGRSPNDLQNYLKEIIPESLRKGLLPYHTPESGTARQEAIKYIASMLGYIESDRRRSVAVSSIHPDKVNPELIPQGFAIIRDAAGLSRERLRYTCSIFFGLAILLFGILIIENLYFVLKYLLW